MRALTEIDSSGKILQTRVYLCSPARARVCVSVSAPEKRAENVLLTAAAAAGETIYTHLHRLCTRARFLFWI